MENLEIVVLKKNNTKEQYSREKLLKGIYKACEKRPICMSNIQAMVDEIEADIRSYKETAIPSQTIGELVMRKLRFLDEVAYLRFASVYRSFADLQSFEEELHKLQNNLTK